MRSCIYFRKHFIVRGENREGGKYKKREENKDTGIQLVYMLGEVEEVSEM